VDNVSVDVKITSHLKCLVKELLLLSAAAAAAIISLVVCSLKKEENVPNDFGCIRCFNIATKEGRTTLSWQSYDRWP